MLVEWWRKDRGGLKDRIIESMTVEATEERLAKIAGDAAGAIGASAVDAIVMASAAQRGDIVLTSDLDDLKRLQEYFPGVKLLRV